MSVVLYSALVRSHLEHSGQFWDTPVTANIPRNWSESSGKMGRELECVLCKEWLVQPGEDEAKEVADCSHQLPKSGY